MILYGKKETSELRKAQLRYISKAKKVDRTKWESRKIPVKTLQGISKLLSPIL
jgi:hypothetical protein